MSADARRQLAAHVAAHGRWVYHLTDASNLASILREGLRPSGSDSEYDRALLSPQHVYLCNEWVATRTLAGHLADWGDAALAVDLTALDPTRLRGDEDYWRGELSDEGRYGLTSAQVKRLRPQMDRLDVVLRALADAGTCSYRGSIPTSALHLAYVAQRSDVPDIDGLRRQMRASPLWGTGVTSPEALKLIE